MSGGRGATAADPAYMRFTVYDLNQGAKRIAAPTETFASVSREGYQYPNQAIGACDGKIVLSLTDPTSRPGPSVRLAVLDLATGATKPPIDVPLPSNASVPTALNGLADAG